MRTPISHDDNLLFLLSNAHWKIHRILAKTFKKKNFDITPDQWLLLLNISNKAPLYQSELVKMQTKDKAAVKRLLDHLDQGGLIHRRTSASDLRKKKVELSEKGLLLLKKLNKTSRDMFQKATVNLTETELNALKRLTRKLGVEER